MCLSIPAVGDDADELFSVTMDLPWWLHDSADEQGGPVVQFDLLCAINELLGGPWRRCPIPRFVPQLPYTVACMLLDELLTRLGAATPDFGARVAVVKAQRCLSKGEPRWGDGFAGPAPHENTRRETVRFRSPVVASQPQRHDGTHATEVRGPAAR